MNFDELVQIYGMQQFPIHNMTYVSASFPLFSSSCMQACNQGVGLGESYGGFIVPLFLRRNLDQHLVLKVSNEHVRFRRMVNNTFSGDFLAIIVPC